MTPGWERPLPPSYAGGVSGHRGMSRTLSRPKSAELVSWWRGKESRVLLLVFRSGYLCISLQGLGEERERKELTVANSHVS